MCLFIYAGLLKALQSESPHSDSASTPSPTCKAEDEYLAPAEAALLADGELAACLACGLTSQLLPLGWAACAEACCTLFSHPAGGFCPARFLHSTK